MTVYKKGFYAKYQYQYLICKPKNSYFGTNAD